MLPLANTPTVNFDVFNRTYAPIADGCYTCSGCGGFLTTEYQGDYPQGGLVDFFTPCGDCICDEKCPGCMQPLALSFDRSAFESKTELVTYANYSYATNMRYLKRSFDYEDALSAMPFDGFICLCCGWTYNPDRHADQYEPDYDGGDYDYPQLDASEYFPF